MLQLTVRESIFVLLRYLDLTITREKSVRQFYPSGAFSVVA